LQIVCVIELDKLVMRDSFYSLHLFKYLFCIL
jgi:hypothetical protein